MLMYILHIVLRFCIFTIMSTTTWWYKNRIISSVTLSIFRQLSKGAMLLNNCCYTSIVFRTSWLCICNDSFIISASKMAQPFQRESVFNSLEHIFVNMFNAGLVNQIIWFGIQFVGNIVSMAHWGPPGIACSPIHNVPCEIISLFL